MEVGAAFADLGTIVPIIGALVLVNGIDPVATLVLFGALFGAAGLFYRAPVPVQPIKAAAAIAIATRAPAGVVAGAGLVLGAVLLVLWALRAGPVLAKLFPKPIIRGNQLGVGLLLLFASSELVRRGPGDDTRALLVATGVLALCLAARGRRLPVALVAVAAGVAWSLAHGGLSAALHPAPTWPSIDLPGAGELALALTLLVIPQLPLTLGNAVVGTADLARDYLGDRAGRVSEGRLMLTAGLGNLAAGVLGATPMCHGSSGLTAYHRLGARGMRANMVAAGMFVLAGVLYGRHALALLGLIPLPVLGGLLACTGIRHALLVVDQRSGALVVAMAMGVVGALTRNLAYGMAVGMAAYALCPLLPGMVAVARRALAPLRLDPGRSGT